ncbi:Fur family transcriptional regulator [Sulfurimonas autotrophica]|uniref:Ferric uptake regulator, Fur family n=1 Tax=Sulfurimonas autotrophica (strain ATCC BAA-671 / DSM 16294 / JCM 11897 / OK10) TaxID=563040 RepID=E0UV70_SULAO|nr:Fur family transcriptional regulator [Sulfurimonas autotrophica]ADN09652.1 ferric uptake regulator, Fur family [Sulfurimonas autotrophica DSM 16294]
MNNYTDILRQHHLKATPQRLEIANALGCNGHMTIEKLYEVMLKKFNSISLATIYKNINLMIENAFIQEVKIPNEKSVYELTKEMHSHIVCRQCNEIHDITLDLSQTAQLASQTSHFKIDKADLVLSGLCQKCQQI